MDTSNNKNQQRYIFSILSKLKASGGDGTTPDFSPTRIEFVESLPAASANTLGVIYVIPNQDGESGSIHFTKYDGQSYSWVAAGEKGDTGDTPNISIGTVTSGEQASATIGGTPANPILNLVLPQGPQGLQGNTGSSVDYPYELVNNLTTNDATKALSAAMGVVLDGKVTQLEAKVDGFVEVQFDFSTGSVAQYANRYVAYDFVSGKKYRIKVLTEDSTIETYFSVRDENGNTVGGMSAISSSSGARSTDFTCTANGARLYMSYKAAGPAIVYDVDIIVLEENNLYTVNERLIELEGDVDILEGRSAKFISYTSPASGTYKGFDIKAEFSKGEPILLGVETNSPDSYYCRGYKGGTLCGIIIATTTGNNVIKYILPWDIDTIQFRIASCSGAYDYTVKFADFVGTMALDAKTDAQNAVSVANDAISKANISSTYTSPSSGTYKGVDFIRNLKSGDKLYIKVETTSPDTYYARAFKNGSLVKSVIPQVTGVREYIFTASAEIDTIQFRVLSCSGVYTYKILMSDYVGCMAKEALDKSTEALDTTREYFLAVPEYATEQKNRILGILRELSTKSCLVVGFNTDQHMSILHNPQNEYYPIARGLNALRSLAETFPFDAIVLGGDETSYTSTTKEEVLTDVNDVIRNCDTSFCPVVALAGNHDAGQNYSYVGADGRQEFNTKTKRNVTRKDAISFGVRSTNLFFDDDANKVRFVFLDRWSRNQSEILPVLNEALSDNKLKNSEWKVLFFSHDVIKEGLSTNNLSPIETNIPEVWTAIQNFVNDGGNVVACVNGHCHKDVQDVYGGIPFIATTCAGKNVEIGFDGIQYTRTNDTPNETAFDVFVFDFTDEKLYCLRYGSGMDRVFNLASGSVGLMLVSVSGTVTGATVGDVVKVSHNNTVYTYTLTSEMGYTFPYICPGLGDWGIVVEHDGSEIYRDTISPALTDTSITKNITIS